MARLLTLLLTAAAAACLLTVTRAEEDLGCINPAGKPVDWYVIYKFNQCPYKCPYKRPISPDECETSCKRPRFQLNTTFNWNEKLQLFGKKYLFVSSESSGDRPWKLYDNKSIDHSESALVRTVGQNYLKSTRYDIFCAYNDQPKDKKQMQGKWGHSKGVLAWNKSSKKGFWLFHSLPRFPLANGELFDTNVDARAQTFLCITMKDEDDLKYANKYIDQVNAYVYIPQHDNPTKERCMVPRKAKTPTTTTTRTTLPSLELESPCWNFGDSNIIVSACTQASSKTAGRDLYKQTAKSQAVNLFASTYGVPKHKRTQGLNRSDSSTGNVEDITYISITNDILSSEESFLFETMLKMDSNQDHSKWAISATQQKSKSDGLVCFGDLNHDLTNMKRAGGIVCSNNSLLFSAFQKLVPTQTEHNGD